MISSSTKYDQDIKNQVMLICDSNEFRPKKILCRFLKFIVDETLAGRNKELKGYTIAISVFDRDKDFDPDHDPIVRIQAGRLRRSLELYYLREGKDDPVRIVIPKGGYTPTFLPNGEIESSPLPSVVSKKVPDHKSLNEPSIAVLPFQNLTGDPEKEYFVQGFSEEISIELTRYEDLKVISCRLTQHSENLVSDSQELSKKLGVHFILDGSVRLDEQKVTILIRLVDAFNSEQVWAERYRRDLSANNLINIQEEIARETARVLGSEYGIILQRLSMTSWRRKPKILDTYEAILRFYYFEAHQSSDLALNAFQALEQALRKDPTSGIATAMLASLYGNAYMLDSPHSSGALEKISQLAEKAVKLDPNSQIVRITYAWKYFVLNEKDRFLEEVDKCLVMNPNSPVRLGSIGFHLSLYGEWERGKVLLDQAMNHNVGFPLFFYGATTLYYYRKHDYTRALQEAKKYDVPALFWGPMLRAAVLGQLDHNDDAQPEIEHLMSLKPDFENKSHFLISRFVKEDELVEHIIEGLQKAGLQITPMLKPFTY